MVKSNLGVVLDTVVPSENQVVAEFFCTFAQLWLVHQPHVQLAQSDLATVIHAFVISKLCYCSVLYLGYPWRLLERCN